MPVKLEIQGQVIIEGEDITDIMLILETFLPRIVMPVVVKIKSEED